MAPAVRQARLGGPALRKPDHREPGQPGSSKDSAVVTGDCEGGACGGGEAGSADPRNDSEAQCKQDGGCKKCSGQAFDDETSRAGGVDNGENDTAEFETDLGAPRNVARQDHEKADVKDGGSERVKNERIEDHGACEAGNGHCK